MRKISLTGPECTGKSTLCAGLQYYLGGIVVPEYAREYLTARNGKYTEQDLVTIAKNQLRLEKEAESQNPAYIFCDTDDIVLRIWSQEKFGRVSGELEKVLSEFKYNFTLLMYNDLPYVEDPLRDSEAERERLFILYERAIFQYRKGLFLVEGLGEDRIECALFWLGAGVKAEGKPFFDID